MAIEAITVEVDGKKYRVEKRGLFRDITEEQAKEIIRDLYKSEEERREMRKCFQGACKVWWRNLRR